MKKFKVTPDGRYEFPISLSPSILSELQTRILIHVCTTPNASYETLSNALKRNRVTILQSLETLIKYRYIYKYKINPNLDKSKLIFAPTHKAMASACRQLQVSISDIIRIRDDEIINYLRFILERSKDLESRDQRIDTLFSKLEQGFLEFYNDSSSRKNLVKVCIYEDLITGSQKQYYDHKYISELRKFLSYEDLEEFAKILVIARDNLNRIVREFSKSI